MEGMTEAEAITGATAEMATVVVAAVPEDRVVQMEEGSRSCP
jgi:hypothetical protein